MHFLRMCFLIMLMSSSFFLVYANNEESLYSKDIEKVNENISILKNNLNNDTLLSLARETYGLAIESRYYNGIGLSCYYLANMFMNRNNIDSAFYYFKEGIGTKGVSNWIKADLYWEYANLNRVVGNFSIALENGLILKNLVEERNIDKYSYKIYNLLGLCYQALMEYEFAKENYRKAVTVGEQKNDYALVGIVYSNLGRLFYEQKKYNKALYFYRKGTKLEEDYELLVSAAYSYNTIANIYLELNMLDSAKIYLEKTSANLNNDITGLADHFLTYGKLFYKKEDYKSSEKYLLKSIEYALSKERKIVLIDAYKLLSEIKFKNKRFEEAYIFSKKHIDIYTNVYDVVKINNVKALEQKFKQKLKESKLVNLELEKRKTTNILLYIIMVLTILLSAIALLYVYHFKSLNKELVDAKNKAEESDRLKSQFLRTISHEIRTPLNGIMGFSEMIVNGELEKNEIDNIQKYITKNSEDLISTIENMVDMAHLTSKQYEIYKSHFELSRLMEKCIRKIKETSLYTSKSNIKIECENNEKLDLFSDKSIVKKIIKELIKNALQYTNEGCITLGFNKENSYVKIFVKDTGIGICQEDLDVILYPFRQTEESYGKESSGTGLGLSIVNEFVDVLGGKLWYGSETNKGTVFFVSIPLK